MWAFYVIALVPVFLGAVLWLSTRRITFKEWMWGSAIGFLVAGGYHFLLLKSMTLDFEVRSGLAVRTTHHPSCLVESGDEQRHVAEHWSVTVDFGRESWNFEIPQEEFDGLAKKFGGKISSEHPIHIDVRDEDYREDVARNLTDAVVPAHTYRTVEGAPKSGSSVLAYQDPPEGLPLHEYPTGMSTGDLRMYLVGETALRYVGDRTVPGDVQIFDWRRSGRLLGRAKDDFSIEAWDALNARVCPEVGVNLIAIGFDGESSLAHWQEAKWTGGKTNDLVICYGPPTPAGTPSWTYCFGWSEDELVRRNLESLVLASPPNDALLPVIQREVVANYRPKEWPEFDPMTVEPPPGSFFTLLLIMFLVQGAYWGFSYVNRTRRSAADAEEEAEVRSEHRESRIEARDRGDLKRIREKLPKVDLKDVRALTRRIEKDEEPYFACMALCRLSDPEVVTGLVIGLTASRFRARELAGRWLDNHVPDPEASPEARAAVPVLIERLAHRSRETRREARRVLDLVEPEWTERPEAGKAVKRLLRNLERDDPGDPVVDALGAHGEAVVEPLLARLADGEETALPHVLCALGATGDHRAVPPLLDHLQGEDRDRRLAATTGLSRFGPGLGDHPVADKLWEALTTGLSAGDPDDRVPVVEALGWLRDERAIELLVPILGVGNKRLRRAAARAMGYLGSPLAIAPLTARFPDVGHDDLLVIIKSLGMIGTREIIPPLIDLFEVKKDGGSLVPETIIHALFPLGGEEIESMLDHASADFHCSVNDLAGLRLLQLRSGFVSPGWDVTAGRN